MKAMCCVRHNPASELYSKEAEHEPALEAWNWPINHRLNEIYGTRHTGGRSGTTETTVFEHFLFLVSRIFTLPQKARSFGLDRERLDPRPTL